MMCYGVFEEGWDIRVDQGVAFLSREGRLITDIPVVTLAKLYRRGMREHRLQEHRPALAGLEFSP